jgi:serine/threonine-protein kinase RsbT
VAALKVPRMASAESDGGRMTHSDGARRIVVRGQRDVERARREARSMALAVGFAIADAERVALATTELATNLVRYADQGELVVSTLAGDARGAGIEIESRDLGPGIPDVEQALVEGFSTDGGLGGGLAGVGRLMDESAIESTPNGTRIVARKWPSPRSSSR